MKPKKRDFYIISALFAIFFLFIFLWVSTRPLEVKTIEVKFIIADKTGFDLSTSPLTFGIIQRGSSSTRRIVMKNNHNYPVKINIYSTRNLESYLSVQNSIILEKNETVKIPVSISVPEDAENGEYNGKMRFEIRKI